MTSITRNDSTYTIDGRVYSRVTTVTGTVPKPWLVPWRERVMLDKVRATLLDLYEQGRTAGGDYVSVLLDELRVDAIIEDARKRPDEICDTAADFGTRAHAAVEEYLKTGTLTVEADLMPVMDNFLSWERKNGLFVTTSERVVYSKVHGYAGTLDMLATRDGAPVLVDLKTSNGIYREYDFQVAAYCKAVEEMDGVQIKEVWILRLAKDKPADPAKAFEAVRVRDVDKAFDVFLRLLDVYEALKGYKA